MATPWNVYIWYSIRNNISDKCFQEISVLCDFCFLCHCYRFTVTFPMMSSYATLICLDYPPDRKVCNFTFGTSCILIGSNVNIHFYVMQFFRTYILTPPLSLSFTHTRISLDCPNNMVSIYVFFYKLSFMHPILCTYLFFLSQHSAKSLVHKFTYWFHKDHH